MSEELALTPTNGVDHVAHATDLTALPLGQLWKLARMLVGTGFLPQELRTPEQALAVMVKGQELRVPPLYALSNIVIVKGKPTCSAELMLALIRRDYGPRMIRVAATDDQHCTVEWRQAGWDGIQSYTFTMADAQRAQLGGGNWQKYPAAMLRARCISAVARMAFPECIAGMYVPDELTPDAAVSDDGDSDEVLRLERGEQAPVVVGQSAQMDNQTAPEAPAPVVQPETMTLVTDWDGEPDPTPTVDAQLEADIDAAFRAQAPAVATAEPPRVRFPYSGRGLKALYASAAVDFGWNGQNDVERALGGSVSAYAKAQQWDGQPDCLDRVWAELKQKHADEGYTVAGRLAATE